MKNKQTLFIVLSMAIVASLLTLAIKTGPSLLNRNNIMALIDNREYDEDLGYAKLNVRQQTNSVRKVSPIAEQVDNQMVAFGVPYYNNDALNVNDRVYQKSARHSVVVGDVATYLRGIKEYVLSIDGRVLSSNLFAGDQYDSGSLYIKVPVKKFDEATNRVTENVEKIVNESINSDDITGQLINTTNNLQNLKDQKSLKEAALKDAKTEVEKRRYRIEIERLEKQIKTAEKNTDRVEAKIEYSTISITAANSERYFNPKAALSVREEFLRAWESLKKTTKIIGYFAIWLLVYSIVLLPLVLLSKKLINAIKR